MTKNELSEFIRDIKKEYPDGSYDLGEWWDMFQAFKLSTLYDGLSEWKNGPYGHRTPSVRDIRSTDQCCMWNPNGMFYKALVRATGGEK